MKTNNIFLALLTLSSALETSAFAATNFQVQVRMGSGAGSVPLVNAEVAVFDQNDIIPRITDGSGIASFGAFPDGDYMFSIRKDGQVLLSLSRFVIDAPGVYMVNLLDGRYELYSPRPGTGSTSGGSSSGGSTSGGSGSGGSSSSGTAGSGGASTPPPPPAACGSHPSGSTWSEPTTVQRAPVACPAEHTGTRTAVFQNYQPKLCTNGVVTNHGSPTQALTGYENSTCVNRAVTGWIDDVIRNQGDYVIRGWACALNTQQSIDVYLFSGGPAGAGLPIGQFKANVTGEVQINQVCGTSGVAHRYQIAINSYLPQHQERSIWIHGLSPFGFTNNILSRSGGLLFPAAPPQPRATSLANVALRKPVYQNVAGNAAYAYGLQNLTDGDTTSYAYPGGWTFDYTVNLLAEHRVQLVRLWWNQWGFNSPNVYVTSWQVQGADDYGTWTTLAAGGVPNASFSELVLDRRMRQVRVIATSSVNWFGVYELQVYGDVVTSPKGAGMSALGDFTGDRMADYVDHHMASGQFWVHANANSGAFSSANAAYGVTAPISVPGQWKTLTGDFNGDGRADFADMSIVSGMVYIHLNNGNGSFSTANWGVTQVNAGPDVEILVGDFNADGRADLMEHNVRTGGFLFRYNQGGGAFAASGSIAWKSMVGSNWTVVAGDFNGDGWCDLADYFIPTGTFWAHYNTGAGFSETNYLHNPIPKPAGADWIRLFGDFTGERRIDYVDLHIPSGQFWVHQNLGTSFDPGNAAFADTMRDASTWRLLGE